MASTSSVPPTRADYDPEKPVVSIKNLDFSYDAGKPNIQSLNLVLPPNSRGILVGANGAGKSTLLRILCGGIYLGLTHDEFDVNGSAKVNDQSNGVAYLGGTWKRRRTGFEGICPYTMDISAFNSDDFEVQSWINEVLREKAADTSLDSHISAVSMKLQILSAVS